MSKVLLMYRRVLHAIDNHGVWGTVSRAFRRFVPAHVNIEPQKPEASRHPFDLLHGVDTSGYIPGEQLGSATGSAADLYNTAYYGISPSTLSAALTRLPVSPDEFTFVDLGCGKGRALLVAAAFPFRELVGVELDAALSRSAAANAEKTAAAGRIRILNTDAVTLEYPAVPLVIYMYHPFLAPLLRRVLKSVERQFRGGSREIYMLFANPIYFDVLAQFKFLVPVWDLDLPLSEEDAIADRHGIVAERYTLYRAQR